MLPAALRSLLAIWLAGLWLLGACAPAPLSEGLPSGASGILTPRPPGSPDVLLLAVSGRCPPPCLGAPDDNINYLEPRGTVRAVAAALEASGLKVVSLAYSSNLTLHRPRRVSANQVGQPLAAGTPLPEQQGFLQLERAFLTAERDWVRGRSNPTRIVLLAHSHGVVWTHALTRAYPDLPVALMIDLDGVCDFWALDNRRTLQSYVHSLGSNPWPFDLSAACGPLQVGHLRYSLKDLVYRGVAQDLEVQSRHLIGGGVAGMGANWPFDGQPNIRPDGSRSGIQTFRSASEDHSDVSYPDSAAVKWVLSQLPGVAAGWKSGAAR